MIYFTKSQGTRLVQVRALEGDYPFYGNLETKPAGASINFRNGQQAVTDATAACKIDFWDSWDYIDTLAAAYAEAGDFANAIRFQEKAIRKAGGEDTKSSQARLALSQQQRPYRFASAR